MNKPTIRFNSASKAILFQAELQGQISDGFWENSRPYDHYKAISSASVSFDTNLPEEKSFCPMKKYNFGNKMLLDIVGDRMLSYVKFYTAFPSLPMSLHHSLPDSLEYMYILRWAKSVFVPEHLGEYWADKSAKLRALFPQCETYLDLSAHVCTELSRVNYEMKNLRKDLKEMSAFVNQGY